jgi:DNA repair exonuclease SbcCD nuclease subunit
MRYLFVGDIHAVPEELEDCHALRKMVEFYTFAEQVDVVVFLGDQYHTHSIIRAEVMAFYRMWFREWRERFSTKIIALTGNHDYAGEGHSVHAMMIHEEQIKVVDKPCRLGGLLFMPYYSDREKFVADANAHPGTNTLVCHQTFVGSRYENGLPALDGIDLKRIPQKTVISGHLHTPQEFDTAIYIGAPRWRSLSDANVDRALWIYDFDAHGNVTNKASFDTSEYCQQIRYVCITPDNLFDGEMDPRHDWRVDIKGPAIFVAVQKKLWARPGVKVRTFLTDKPISKVRESEGIGTAFRKFLKEYKPTNGTPIEVLEDMARERLGL